MLAQVSITVQVAGGELKTYTFPNAAYPYPPQLTSSPSTEFTYQLSNGVLVNVPFGARYALIIPAQGNAGAIVLAGNSADVGVPVDPQNPSLLALPSGTTNLRFVTPTSATANIAFF